MHRTRNITLTTLIPPVDYKHFAVHLHRRRHLSNKTFIISNTNIIQLINNSKLKIHCS